MMLATCIVIAVLELHSSSIVAFCSFEIRPADIDEKAVVVDDTEGGRPDSDPKQVCNLLMQRFHCSTTFDLGFS
jgi:hypothetical protein